MKGASPLVTFVTCGFRFSLNTIKITTPTEKNKMSWYDDASNESMRNRSRSESIYREAEKIFNLLWSAITKEISDLQSQRKAQIITNGSQFERFLRHQAAATRLDGSSHSVREMRIRLTADRTAILANAPSVGEYGPSHVEFELVQTEVDGLVRLMHNKHLIEIQEAAVMVVRNLLFPDLPLSGK